MSGGRYTPICQLNTYTPRWSILAKVVEKQSQTFKKNEKNGNILSVDLMDTEGSTIRAKLWNDSADKWEKILEKNKVYSFSKGRINVANPKFNPLPHQYELSFEANAEIVLKPEKISEFSSVKVAAPRYEFQTLRDIFNSPKELPFNADVLVFVTDVRPSEQIQSKRNPSETITRRIISVVDASEFELSITLWEDHATEHDWDNKNEKKKKKKKKVLCVDT
eukprot:Trichotokara_eunicae@DN3441_c0_g1_i5.p1